MLDVSSPGRAEHKQKSIDVGANLLASWLSEKSRLRETASKLLVATLLTGVSGLLILPLIRGVQVSADAERLRAQEELVNLDQTLQTQLARQKGLKPKVAMSEMLQTSRMESDLFLGHVIYLLNSGSPRTVVNSMRVEIFAGDMTIRCDANAESTADARLFADAVGRAPGTREHIIAATRPNEVMGPSGVSFEFIAKVEADR